MNWDDWTADAGGVLQHSLDPIALLAVLAVIIGALVIGLIVGGRASPGLSELAQRLGGEKWTIDGKRAAGMISSAVTSLVLLFAANVIEFAAIAQIVLALALGLGVASLFYRIARACGLGKTIASLMGGLSLLAAAGTSLGGTRRVVESLDGIGFSVGTHRFSLLAASNAVVIVSVLYIIARAVHHILVHLIGRTNGLDVSQRALVQKLGGIGVIAIATLLGIDLLGIDLTALTVFSGAAGLAVGFGLQKTFGNLIAGLILLMDRSVKPGDVIAVGDTFGSVGKIGVRAVSVLTRDGKEHLIPNEKLMTEAVENWSYSDRDVRLHIPVGIAYSSDLALAQRLMVEAACASARVLPQPEPSVWLKAFGESSVDHDILVWIADPELGVGSVRSEILKRLWELFALHGVEIPYPQRDIHVRSVTLPPQH